MVISRNMNAVASMRPRFAAVSHIDTLKRSVYLSYCVFVVPAFDPNLLSIVFTPPVKKFGFVFVVFTTLVPSRDTFLLKGSICVDNSSHSLGHSHRWTDHGLRMRERSDPASLG